MATQNSYRFRFDGSVTLTLILAGAISLFILAFRVKNSKPYSAITIHTRDSIYYQDAAVSLSASSNDVQRFEWDFGDSTTEVSNVPNVIHRYKEPGTYTVTLTAPDKDPFWKRLRIMPSPKITDTHLQPTFTVPDVVMVGKQATFTDNTSGATSWEWSFGESDDVDNTNRVASYIYKSPGSKKVYLKINGQYDRATEKLILVKADPRMEEKESKPRVEAKVNHNQPKPQMKDTPTTKSNKPEEVKKEEWPSISNSDFREQLKLVASGIRTSTDFSKYLCDPNIEANYNGETMNFSEMCKKIKDEMEDANYVKSVSVIQKKFDNNSGCVTGVIVKMEKYGWGKRVWIKKYKKDN